jgi:phosphoribosylamine-glycine ligase
MLRERGRGRSASKRSRACGSWSRTYCPAPVATPELLVTIDREVLVPTVHARKRGRRPFRCVLYAGLMVTG